MDSGKYGIALSETDAELCKSQIIQTLDKCYLE